MFYGASGFLANADLRRFVAITGWKGAGKDLLTQELVEWYLRRKSRKTKDYYKLFTNQQCVWCDELRKEDGTYNDMYGSVFWLSEAGMYIRRMSDFRNPFALARKLDNYFFFPSIELPHAVLTSFIVEPVGKFQEMLGLWYNPIWAYTVEGGHGRSYGGTFLWFPNKSEIGVYDTDDPSDVTEEILQGYSETVRREQEKRNRQYKISAVVGVEENETLDAETVYHFANIQREIALSLQDAANQAKKK